MVLFQVLLKSTFASHPFEELNIPNCGIEGGVEQLLDLWKQILAGSSTIQNLSQWAH